MKGELKRIWYSEKTNKYATEGLAGGNRTNLVCDTETKVVYYQLPNGYMSPYIGQNGKFCKLVANEIVEID